MFGRRRMVSRREGKSAFGWGVVGRMYGVLSWNGLYKAQIEAKLRPTKPIEKMI